MLASLAKFKIPLASCALVACLAGTASAQAWRLQCWTSYGGNAQHTANSLNSAEPIKRILWSTPVDTDPQYDGTELLAHYAAPLVNFVGTVLVTVKTGAAGSFQVEAHNGYTGGLQWTQTTDYVVPPYDRWFPICGSSLVGPLGMVTPGVGGTVYLRARTDLANSSVTQMAFYGMAGAKGYTNNKAAFNSNVFICTPITVDNQNNIFFGFRVTGANPAGLTNGIARISSTGVGTWVSANAVSGNPSFDQPAMNCAPALSNDQKTLYIGIRNSSNGGDGGAIVGVGSTTLAAKYSASLFDPRTSNPAILGDPSSATPMVGPDGDVYYGVLENPQNNSRGWMIHYDATLTQQKIPGAFGWDDTASIVPRSCVPSYTGTSSYLLLTKYNYYAGYGGDGTNRVAILDPNASFVKPSSGVPVMVEVQTVLGPTPDQGAINLGFPNAVHEWCINSAAIDARTRSAIINSEDGKCYRWDLASNTLTQSLVLSSGLGEAYTSTVIGKFGVSFAINNARLCAVGN